MEDRDVIEFARVLNCIALIDSGGELNRGGGFMFFMHADQTAVGQQPGIHEIMFGSFCLLYQGKSLTPTLSRVIKRLSFCSGGSKNQWPRALGVKDTNISAARAFSFRGTCNKSCCRGRRCWFQMTEKKSL